MGLISAEYRDRIDHWIRTLKEDFYTPAGNLELECFCTMDHLTYEEAKTQTFVPAHQGMIWGHTYEYAWFRAILKIPVELEGKRCVLNLNPGGESTLFLNGEEFGTYRADWVKEHHHYMVDNFLTVAANTGDCYEFYMETYAGHYYPEAPGRACATGPVIPGSFVDPLEEGSRRQLGACTYGAWDEDAYQLYMDVMTLKGLLEVTDKDALRSQRIAEALEQFTLIVDFEQDKEKRSEDYRRARLAMRPVLEAKNGSTMPVFYAIGNAHLDLVWLWPLEETKRKTARTFAAQLRLMDEYKDYRFIQSQPAVYEMCRKCYPKLFEKIKAAIKSGQWIAEGAMWVEPDTNMAGGEALIRQLLYGKQYYKEMFDVDSRLLWLPDTFGYTAALPQILKGCHVEYLVTQKIFWSYNDGEQFPYHYFKWRGMDGSEVVSFLPTSYTYDTDPVELNTVWKNRVQKRNLDTFLLPFGYGDGGGGPSRDHIEYLERQKNLEGGVKVEIENPVKYFDDMNQMGAPKDTYVGELYFTAHRGTYTSQAAIKKWNRRAEGALRDMEIWGSAELLEIGRSYPKDGADALWKELLTNQFHDILPGSSIDRVYKEAEKSLASVVEKATETTLASIGHLVKSGEGITIFNSLSFSRTELIDVPTCYEKGGCTEEGVPVSVYSAKQGTRALVKLPSMGAVTIIPAVGVKVDSPIDCASVTETTDGFIMENKNLRILIMANGEIVSYVEKKSGREFASAPMNHFRLFKDVPRKFDAWDIDSNYREQEIEGAFDVHAEIVERDGAKAVLVICGKIGNSSYEQQLILTAHGKRVEFQTEVDWRELHRLLKVGFPVSIYAENGINEIQFGYVERPMHRSGNYEKDRFEVCNHRYSAVCDGGSGFAVFNDCKYGISMEDGALELTLLRAGACPEMRADNKIHRFTYGISAWIGSFQDSDVVRQGYEMNEKPLIVGGMVKKFSLIQVEKENIILEAMKPAEDGSGDLILRFYESKRQRSSTEIELGFPVKNVWYCDMLENKQDKLAMQESCFTLDFRAFEIKTIRLEAI